MSTHEEIASALVLRYQLLITSGYLRNDQMDWPPHMPDPLNRALCRKLGFEDSAIDLLPKIPWVKGGTNIVWNSRWVD